MLCGHLVKNIVYQKIIYDFGNLGKRTLYKIYKEKDITFEKYLEIL